MSPDGALNRLEHTLPCSKFLKAHFAVHWQQDNSGSWAQEREGHTLSTKTLRSHVTRDYTVSASALSVIGAYKYKQLLIMQFF